MIPIADNAILRYFERVDRVDIAQVRARMLAAGVPADVVRRDAGVIRWMDENGYGVAAVKLSFEIPALTNAVAIGAKNLHHPDGFWMVLKGGSVVSVILDDMAVPGRRPPPPPREKRPYYVTRKKWNK